MRFLAAVQDIMTGEIFLSSESFIAMFATEWLVFIMHIFNMHLKSCFAVEHLLTDIALKSILAYCA